MTPSEPMSEARSGRTLGATPLKRRPRMWVKPIAFWVLIAPLAWLVWQWTALLSGWPHALGFNPIEATHRFLGDTAIRVLLATLALSPLRDWTGWSGWILVRRRAGLFAFGYAALHVVAYLGFDLLFSLPALWEDVVRRRYITAGMAAFALMAPLAATSHNAAIRRLGARAWRRLHMLVHPIAALAVLHHFWMVKGDQVAPLVHGAILAVLFAHRLGRVGVARMPEALRGLPHGLRPPPRDVDPRRAGR